jgi:hypothetical protein
VGAFVVGDGLIAVLGVAGALVALNVLSYALGLLNGLVG